MFMRKIARLLLLNCIVLISCRSSLIQPSEESTADMRDRSPRSIWPFTLWSGNPTRRTDEDDAPVSDPTVEDENVLLDALNLREYPIWRVHRCHGIDLKPMEIQALSPSDRARLLSSISNEERARYGDAEGGQMISPIDVVHATPGALEITHGERVSNYVRVAQGEISRTADERDSTRPDLSFLDDLGGLAHFLPGPEDDDDASARTTEQNEMVEAPSAVRTETGIFDGSFLSKLLGRQTDGAITTVRPVIEDEGSEDTEPGFLGWLFGFGSSKKTKRPIETKLIEPVDYYYLPGTVDSYVLIKLPANVDSRLKSRLTARLNPRIASFVSDDTTSAFLPSLDHSETPSITTTPAPKTPVNYSDEIVEDNRLQTIRKISDDNLPIREAVDSHGNDESIKDRETESSKKIYSGYSKVRQSSDNLTEESVVDSSTSRSI